MPFCQVIVDINHTDVDHVFTYRVPAGLDVCPGMRVHVPFGPRKLEGVVVEMAADCDLPPERVKDICDTLEDYPAVLPPLLELAKEIQRTSFCTLAVALRLMFPAQMRGQRIREKQQEVAVLTVAPDVLGQVIAAQVRAPKRAKVRPQQRKHAAAVLHLSAGLHQYELWRFLDSDGDYARYPADRIGSALLQSGPKDPLRLRQEGMNDENDS